MSADRNKRELLRKKRESQKRRTIYTILSILFGIILFLGLVVFLPKLLIKPVNYEASEGFTVGDPDAPVKVVVFSNYTCGYCKIYSETLEKDFITDYVETGNVFYRYVNIPYNDEGSLNAAEASHCAADQDKFFEYKTLLYTYASAAEGFAIDKLVNYSEAAGLDVEEFKSCMDNDNFANSYLEDRRYAQSVGVTGTPTFLVNDQLVMSSELIPTVESFLGN
jgi:protein-disulfide isomerase